MPAPIAFPHDLQIAGSTDLDVATAIATDAPFPSRPDGTIRLGSVGLSTRSGAPLTFDAAGLPVTARVSAGIAASAGVFDTPAKALQALNLGETPGLNLAPIAGADDRYVLLATSYTASATVSGTHPLGALGSLSIGVNAPAAGTLAVLHRFQKSDGARSVLTDTVKSAGLPRQVDSAAALTPGTWLIGEAEGSIALTVAAALGYNVDFIRQLKTGQLGGDVGLKIDAALTASFGLEIGGRYVLVVGRESADERVRVRLFKLSHRGLSFGLNLKIGVTGVETLTPNRIDDLIKAVFGVHGVQIATALERIDQWTDPNQSVGRFVAGLTNAKALALVQELTGKDPRQEFNAARQVVVKAIQQWRNLGATVSAELWKIVGEIGPAETRELRDTLTALATTGAAQRRAFEDAISLVNFSTTPIGRILTATAENGVLGLIDRLPEVRTLAQNALEVLNGDVITNLQKYVERELGLGKVIDAVDKTDFNSLDAWLVGRLSAFFDKDLHFEDLDDIKSTIHRALARRQEIYGTLRTALNSRYAAAFAGAWQRTTADTAVFDVEFDTAGATGRALLRQLLTASDVDAILTSTSPEVRIRAGVLTHEATTKTTISLTLPHIDLQTQTVNEALATVQVDASGPGILAYQASGTDTIVAKNRYRSSLAVSMAATVTAASASSDLRIHALDSTWSYELRHAKASMKRRELDALTRPFIEAYMAAQFTGGTTLSDWYRQLDDSIESRLHRGPDVFGDVCTSLEVTLPNATLSAWFRPAADVNTPAKAISLAIQRSLKDVLAFSFLTDVTRLHDLASSAAILTWASMPAAIGSGGDVMRDFRDSADLAAMIDGAKARLTARLAGLRLRLEEAGLHGDVAFYADAQTNALAAAAQAAGRPWLDSLLVFEREVVLRAVDAYRDAQASIAATAPSKALDRLAMFAGEITSAFNTLAGQSPFAGPSFRAVSQSIFVEAARAIDPALTVRPAALLTLSVVQPVRTFDLTSFARGQIPPAAEVVLGQRLVSL